GGAAARRRAGPPVVSAPSAGTPGSAPDGPFPAAPCADPLRARLGGSLRLTGRAGDGPPADPRANGADRARRGRPPSRARGASVPGSPPLAVARRAVHGWTPAAYDELVGVNYRPAAQLPPSELAARLDRILAAGERVIALVPDPEMDYKPPQRDRTIRNLAY